MSKPASWKRYEWVLGWLALVAVVAYALNLGSFLAESQRLGGDAINGNERNGHYYVSSRGNNIEIPKAEWEQNRTQGMILLTTWPLAFASIGYLMMRHVFPFVVSTRKYRARPKGRAEAVEEIVRSGQVLASVRTQGQMSAVHSLSPFNAWLWVYLYPGGILLSAVPMGDFALRLEEITAVIYRRKALLYYGAEIIHSSPNIAGPVFLNDVTPHAAFGQALNALVGPGKWVDFEGQTRATGDREHTYQRDREEPENGDGAS